MSRFDKSTANFNKEKQILRHLDKYTRKIYKYKEKVSNNFVPEKKSRKTYR